MREEGDVQVPAVHNSSLIGRVAAIAAVVIALVAVGIIVLSSGSTYQVRAVFQNASQIVSGDQVEVAGNPIGTVSNIALTRNGEAQLTLSISNKAFDPLRRGTQATIRELSLSGIASRYVSLTPGPVNHAAIADHGVIPTSDTTSEVDLDEIFDTLNGPTLKGLQDLFQGSASQYKGSGKLAQQALQYLNPAVAASSMLFRELNRDTGKFTNFIVKTSNLVSDVATRSSDLSGLVSHLSTTTQALAAQRTNLASSLQQLPPFMRLANTTFVNLRSALDDLKPLVDDSKPVAPKLEKLLVQLRPLARNSVPTLNDLSSIISRPGPANDLIDLTKLGVPLEAATVENINANGKVRAGAFPQSTTALNDSTPELATARPYAVDLTGWFEGYSHPGTVDANGGASRIAVVVGLGSIENGALNLLPAYTTPACRAIDAFGNATGLTGLTGVADSVCSVAGAAGATNSSQGVLVTGQYNRCPGSMERGALYYPESGFPCDPSEVPTGK
jgi:phospholipid/cholesterol/gamma-HCH transport system substrate-binding protein